MQETNVLAIKIIVYFVKLYLMQDRSSKSMSNGKQNLIDMPSNSKSVQELPQNLMSEKLMKSFIAVCIFSATAQPTDGISS